MASFKAKKVREKGVEWREKAQARRRRLAMESLESRRLLATTPTLPPIWKPGNNNLFDAQNGPLANEGSTLINVYKEYQTYVAGGSQGAFKPSEASWINFKGTSVQVEARGYGAASTFVAGLQGIGLQVGNSAAVGGETEVVGYLPINQLPALASAPQMVGAAPGYKPSYAAFTGQADNEAQTALGADVAAKQFGVTGAGVTVGVLSDSVNQFPQTGTPANGAGIFQSIATGDIPAASRVNILQDGDPGSTDEGRAMIENIFDIAPGVNTAFATAGNDDLSFAKNIVALNTQAHSQVEVDDVGFVDEPFFQDGPIAQAVHTVVNSGVTYFSAAGNADSNGYQSPFRAVSANPLNAGQGTYFNFNNGGGAAQPTIQINIPFASQNSPAILDLQWDAPFFTQSGVNTNVNILLWDSGGNPVITAANNTNAVATQQPQQAFGILAPGTYTLALQVSTAAVPGEVRIQQFGDNVITFGVPTSTAGGVSFPTSSGHNATTGMIGTGATPFWGVGPFASDDVSGPSNSNEPYSSTGPSIQFFAPDGTRLATPVSVLQPLVSAPDAGNTSFFIPGQFIDTTNPGFPGVPSTKTNHAQPNFPTFTGTSSAAPNLAAVAALMKQLDPAATPPLIAQAMVASATPLNGGAKGVWNPDGGFGEVNAVAALAFVNVLRVASITPGGGQVVGQTPAFLQVAFNQPVNFATITPGDLVVVGPAGTKVNVGAPFAAPVPGNNPAFPTVVDFPINIVHAPGVPANGTYVDAFVNMTSTVIAQGGSTLIGSAADTFKLADVTPPKITGTSFLGRTIKINFSEPIDPTTVTKGNFILVRANNATGTLGTASQVIVSNDARANLIYDPTTNTVTMDLTGVPQTLLPSDTYALIVASPTFSATRQLLTGGVTDLVGNALDGEFNGVNFPTGNGVAGGNFAELLPNVALQGPIFNFVQLAPASDSGIPGDQNTDVRTPTFVGQLGANFPGTVGGVLIIAEFAGLHGGKTDLGVGLGGRGFVGTFDATAFTDAAGQFTISAPAALAEGLNNVVFVAVAPGDVSVLPGFATATSRTFREDYSLPTITASSIPADSNLNSLTSLTFSVADKVNPQQPGNPFAVPTLLSVPALNPATADNISNYALFLKGANGALIDESSFIASATFTSTSNRTHTFDPYTGTIALTFSPGMPSGSYILVAKDSITDAAGNPLAGNLTAPGVPSNFDFSFVLQASPAFILSVKAISGSIQSNPRAYFEEPASAGIPNADGTPTPPTAFILYTSNPLKDLGPGGYNNLVQLVASADTPGGAPDGNFGTLGTSDDGSGYSLVPGTTVTLTSIPHPDGTLPAAGQPGFDQELILTVPAGTTLPADYYRLYIPNNVNPTSGADERIFDIYNNQLDGEFLGDQTANGTFEDLLPTGQYRSGLSGDGVAGGSFATGYLVVPQGNVIFANPSYQYDPNNPATLPNGTPLRPYPVLAPEAVPTLKNGGNLNSPVNAGPNFNVAFDRNGDGKFEPSALFAAKQAALNGPVVVVAEPGTIFTNPVTGQTTQATFVLQAPATGNSGVNNGSAAVPAMTTLVFQPGSTLKLENASLLVQNQGSALEALGGAGSGQQVTFTSFADDSVGGDTNGDRANTIARGGDWGGIVFRNFDQQNRTSLFPGQIPTTGSPAVDNRLKGPGGADAISGADDLLSTLNFAVVKFGGGLVPQGIGTRYDAITMQASRPAITNSAITNAGTGTGGDAGVSVDVDALREDNLARGSLLRRLTFADNALNGIYVRSESNGIAEPTDAISFAINNSNVGGAQNYVMDDPYPYLFTTPMIVGSIFQQETGGQQTTEPDRLYIQPGMLLKFESGSGLEVKSIGTSGRQPSVNIGVRTYINEFDNTPNLSPVLVDGSPNPNFVANSTNNATVLLTSFFDDAASTSYTDPLTQIKTLIVPALPATVANNPFQPTPGNVPTQARWGGVQIDSPAVAVINNTTFQYAGGQVNTPAGTTGRHALELSGATAFFTGGGGIFGGAIPTGTGSGTHVSITDDNFFFNGNFDLSNPDDTRNEVPIAITPDGLLGGNPDEPLLSGAPFIHNNVFAGNGINGVGVSGSGNIRENDVVDVNSVWPGADFTYIVRDTIAMGPDISYLRPAVVNPTVPGTEPKASVTLTIQSTLPGTILADGSVVPKPGVPVIIKLGNKATPAVGNTTTPTIGSEINEGPGFVSGMDNGVDPTADPLLDIGLDSDMRFLGIGANQATGQTRVPVVLTSIHDSTVGTTVRGVAMNVAITGDTQAPQAGDGGNIIFGSHTMTSYNLYDPRQGNLIDNVDARYMTRIEQIGGGFIQSFDTSGTGQFNAQTEPLTSLLLGQPLQLFDPLTSQLVESFANEYNGPNALTISNSNISNFRDFGFWAHPGFPPLIEDMNYQGTLLTRAGIPEPQESTLSFLVNNTFSNITGNPAVEIDGNSIPFPTSAGGVEPDTTEAVVLNNTFYNNLVGLDLNDPAVPGSAMGTPVPSSIGTYGNPSDLGSGNRASDATVLFMNNIFDLNAYAGVGLQHGVAGSQGQYNLFFGNGGGNGTPPAGGFNLSPEVANNGASFFGGNSQPVVGDPAFVNPGAGDFHLTSASAAINAARSELGPAIIGDMLFPAANQVLNASGGTLNFLGRINSFGADGFIPTPLDFVYLPGSPIPNFQTSWVPVLPNSPNAVPGPDSNAGTWDYAPLTAIAQSSNGTVVVPPGGGERDQSGIERFDNLNAPVTGAGSQPYFDIGAFEFIQFFPPEVTGVTATFLDPTSATGATTKSIYAVGGIAGTNVPPQSIQVQFNHQIDPSTISSSTVMLEASTDGTFNSNSPTTTFINLAGKLTFDSTTDVLTITLGASGLALSNAEYRLILVGSGSNELRDPQGNALDGSNLDATGQQKALPSGTGIPGSNFQVTFTIDTHPPVLVPGSFALAPSSYTNPDSLGSGVTNQTLPTFQGSITDIFPPANPVQGDTVIIDVSSKGNGVFDLLNAGVGTTDANGNFSVTLTKPVPPSAYTVGPDGIIGTADDTGRTMARVRVIDQSGNVTNTAAGTITSFAAQGALTSFIVDTTPPTITAITPKANTVAAVTNGAIPVTVDFNKNVDLKTITNGSVVVVRSGGDGIFGNANDVTMAIDPTSVRGTFLKTGPLGPERVTFNVVGTAGAALANDDYQITFKGTGATPILDIAGNRLNGGTDVSSTTIVFSPSLSNHIFVGLTVSDATAKQGTAENPFPTITAGLAAAKVGDVVAVFPGVYTESINLKSLVTLESASLLSTDDNIVHGDPLQTIIRAPQSINPTITVVGQNLVSAAGGALNTSLIGFTISSPLQFDPAAGPINDFSEGISLSNSDVVVADDYVVDSGVGIAIFASAPGAPMPSIINDVVVGNTTGIGVFDSTSSVANQGMIINSDILFNTFGLAISGGVSAPILTAANNIFWQNHSQDGTAGDAIGASTPNLIFLYSNMFGDNGPSIASPADDTFDLAAGGGFNPANLRVGAPDAWGNFIGEPAFVSPRDPRPGSDGPGAFFIDADFDLTAKSAAIDRANPFFAPATDLLFRGRTATGGAFTIPYLTALGLPGTSGPADVGAMEFNGTGGIGLTAVATTLFSGGNFVGSRTAAAQFRTGGVSVSSKPTALSVRFSSAVNIATIKANDLVISGLGKGTLRVTGASLEPDGHTVDFFLAGGYAASGGTVTLSLPRSGLLSRSGQLVSSFTDTVTLGTTSPPPPPPIIPTPPPPPPGTSSPPPPPIVIGTPPSSSHG